MDSWTFPAMFSAFREAYWQYKNEVLEQTKAEMAAILKRWREHHYWAKHRSGHVPGLTIPSPVQDTDLRIKRLESVEDKVRRQPTRFPAGFAPESFRQMDDALGARIVVYFLSDLTLVHNALHDLSDDLEIQSDPSTTAYLPEGLPERLNLGNVSRDEKPSGYASVHYRCRLLRSAVRSEDRPLIEIQVRTLAEHAWAEIHHLIGYKREKATSVEAEEETRIISGHLKVIDEHFDLLRTRLGAAQEAIPKPSGRQPLNAENLPKVLQELSLDADQREVDGLLRTMASRGIRTVKDFRARATSQRVALIQTNWQRLTGREAETFDVMGVLGTMSPNADEVELERLIKEWAEVANRWRRRRDDDAFDRTMRAFENYGVKEAKEIATRASTRRINIVRAAWQETAGRPPTPLQVMGVFAVLNAAATIAKWITARAGWRLSLSAWVGGR